MPAKDRTRRRVVPRQPRAQQTVDAILQAAEQVIDARGFERATTNAIAARAGVNVALLYRYFAGREALVAALVERAIASTEAAVDAAVTAGRDQPLREALRLVLVAAMRHPSPGLHRVLVERIDAARRRPLLDDLRTRLRPRLESLLSAHAREVRSLDDRAATLFVLEHAMESGAHAAVFYRPADIDETRAVEQLVEMVARYLAPRPRRRA